MSRWHKFVKPPGNKSFYMKTFLYTIIMIAGCWLAANAQTPTPDPDTLKDPVKDIDPEVKQLPPDMHYADEAVRINADELPAVVLDSLKKLAPAGWEKSVVYRYKNDQTYIVEIRDEGHEKTYKFSKDGKRLKSPDEDRKH
jgi:hypothetical protein